VKSLYETGRPEMNLDKGDKKGPISVAVAVSAPAPTATASEDPAAPRPESRLVVVGDSDFAGNNDLAFQGNGDLFLNAVNWLAQQENLIAIRPKDPEDRRLQLSQNEQWYINLLALAIIPLLMFGNAFRVYWKKR
jgi:ABC-type uncharacterized transport system involved in gliding motility auxiliary subunit